MVETKLLYPLYTLTSAAEHHSTRFERPTAIGAFNVNFYSQAVGILKGLEIARAPGIIQASKGACDFQGSPLEIQKMTLSAMKDLNHEYPICLHLDHGNKDSCLQCIYSGFSSVMIDASTKKREEIRNGNKVIIEEKTPLEENIEATKEIVKAAHKSGISVEGEIGVLRGKEGDKESSVEIYASPEEIFEYGIRSKLDIIAPACGTCHGPIKEFKKLEEGLLEGARQMFYEEGIEMPFCLHGSSTIPPEMVAEFMKYGGKIKKASGVPMSAIKRAIELGVRKVNIDSDLRMGITTVFRKYFQEHQGIQNTNEILKGIYDILYGNKEAKDPKSGKILVNAEVLDPRVYLVDVPKELLRKSPKGSCLEEVMSLVEAQVSNHVASLVYQFGSVGLTIDRGLTLEAMASKYNK